VLALADSTAVIIQGIGGSEEHEKKFEKWAAETRDILVQEMGFSKERVLLLTGEATRKASVEKTFEQLKQQIRSDDNLVLFLIGHGSFDTDYKLNIMGSPDLSGREYVKMIDALNPGRTVIVSSTASSGGMFETMSGRNRVIVAAARSGEKQDTVFYEHFLNGLKGAAADEDKDKKVSVWEAFKYAVSGVERFYKEKTQIMTEHAAINGAGVPQVESKVAEQDAPVLARVTILNADRAIVVADARLQALLNEKRVIEMNVEKLRLDKPLLKEAEYERRLEELILELARKNQQIQELQKQ
jgi:hypothetical protein